MEQQPERNVGEADGRWKMVSLFLEAEEKLDSLERRIRRLGLHHKELVLRTLDLVDPDASLAAYPDRLRDFEHWDRRLWDRTRYIELATGASACMTPYTWVTAHDTESNRIAVGQLDEEDYLERASLLQDRLIELELAVILREAIRTEASSITRTSVAFEYLGQRKRAAA